MNKINDLANKVSELRYKIEKDTYQLKEIKKELLKLMNEENLTKLKTKKSIIFNSKWKSNYSYLLKKEFNKIDEEKKKEFLNYELLKIKYTLNTAKYEEFKKNNKITELDEFVINRKNKNFLQIKFNEEIKDELKNTKINSNYIENKLEKSDINNENEEIDEEIDEEINGREEDWDFSIDYEPDDEDENY